ncbi:MAG: hypothetical protein D6753_02130 [Planctomycetota bacterium]|nr:MAG: hypothetical protein D6753_02130 [Planctomycetota bacterium]
MHHWSNRPDREVQCPVSVRYLVSWADHPSPPPRRGTIVDSINRKIESWRIGPGRQRLIRWWQNDGDLHEEQVQATAVPELRVGACESSSAGS